MVIKDLFFLTRRQKWIAKSIPLFFLSLLICGDIYLVLNKTISNNVFILTLLLLISISVIIERSYKNERLKYGFMIVRYFLKKKRKTPMRLARFIERHHNQVTACETLQNYQGEILHIYGLPKRGKTTAAFFALEGVFINEAKSVTDVKKIIFIDCSVDREEVLKEFDSKYEDRIDKFANTIVVLDNVESLGSYFLEDIRRVILSNRNTFIVIEDNENSIITNELLPATNQLYFEGVYENDFIEQNEEILTYIKPSDKYVFFGIYISVYIRKYAHIDLIVQVSKRTRSEVMESLKDRTIREIFDFMPFTEDYIYCRNKKLFNSILCKFHEDSAFKYLWRKSFEGNYFNEEGKWICLVFCPSDYLNHENIHRKELFNKALSGSRISLLYNTLQQFEGIDDDKLARYAYEYGVLNYYMGNNKYSFEILKKHLKNLSGEEQMLTTIRMIETFHGSKSPEVHSMLEGYITELIKSHTYHLYGKHWKEHILTERGIFQIDTLWEICGNFLHFTPKDDNIYLETTRRCFTDLLRVYHILGVNPSQTQLLAFTDYLKSLDKNQEIYYKSIYVDIPNIQYYKLPLLNFSDAEAARELIEEADEYYNHAETLPVNEKSKRATRVKHAELKMFYSDSTAENAIKTINEFMIHSKENEVDAHEAYAQTLLAKIKIIDSHHLESRMRGQDYYPHEMIIGHLSKARELYQEYGNEYGKFRVDFITLLYEIFRNYPDYNNRPELYSNSCKKVNDLLNKYPKYHREHAHWKRFSQYNQPNMTIGLIIWAIRSYPIILQ